MMRVKRLSGLQLEVLGLYRSLLRSAMKKGSTKGQLYQFGEHFTRIFVLHLLSFY